MGSCILQLCTPFSSPLYPINQGRGSDRTTRCYSTKYGGRSGGSQWDRRNVREDERRSRIDDEYFYTDGENLGKEFGFRGRQRRWWSDDTAAWNMDDEEDDEGFGVLEGLIGSSWILKVMRSLGWMLPAIIISMLLGTGPNAFIMALALPLAQSVLSLVIDTLWERSSDNPRPKPKSRKRPFVRVANDIGKRNKKEQTKAGQQPDNYQSRVAADKVSAQKSKQRAQDFGGWDELDKQVRTDETAKMPPVQNVEELRQESRVKLSKTRRRRDAPLLMRLLIAFFPFLGFWSKLL